MASQIGKHNSSLEPGSALKKMTESPTGFSFFQAVRLAKKALGTNETTEASLRFRVNTDLSFPSSDISTINFGKKDENLFIEMTLNLMGLHGSGSPLPSYFTEYIAQHNDELCPIRDFFDLFNHRLVEMFYETWLKYRYHFQFEENASDKLSSRFFSFLGLGHDLLRETEDVDCVKLLSYMGLIAFSGEATGSLESILRHYFGHRELSIESCVKREVLIPEDQITYLGQANSSLDGNCLIGEQVEDQTGKFKVVISDLTWELFNRFLPIGDTFPKLKALIRFVMKSQLSFCVELRLKKDEVPPLIIGEDCKCRLAWSAWLGEGSDGVVLLETS